jgi:hypothetical protein
MTCTATVLTVSYLNQVTHHQQHGQMWLPTITSPLTSLISNNRYRQADDKQLLSQF